MGRIDTRSGAALALLGLTERASAADVAAAYRRLALETHPDRCAEPGAAARFAALNEAYRLALTLAEPEPAPPVAPAEPPAVPTDRPPRRPVRFATGPVQFAAGPVHYTPSPDAGVRAQGRG